MKMSKVEVDFDDFARVRDLDGFPGVFAVPETVSKESAIVSYCM